MPDGNLKVAPGLPTERALNLNLSEVDRPVAFGLPLASSDIEPRCTFDPGSEASMHGVLAQFEGWLRLLRAEFVPGRAAHRARGDAAARRLPRQPQRQPAGRGRPSRGQVCDCSRRPSGRLVGGRVGQAARGRARHAPGFRAALRLPGWPGRTCAAPTATCCRRAIAPPRSTTATCPACPCGGCNDSQLLLLRELSVEPGNLPDSAPAHRLVGERSRARPDLPVLRWPRSLPRSPGPRSCRRQGATATPLGRAGPGIAVEQRASIQAT